MRDPEGFPFDHLEGWIQPLSIEDAAWWIDFATRFKVIIFSERFRRSLKSRFGERGLALIEIAVLFSRVHDPADFNSFRQGVTRLARSEGVRLNNVGKRPVAEMEALVDGLAPVLLYLGLPLACGSYSKLVTTLSEVSRQLGVEGDARSVLRRIRSRKKALSEFSHSVAIQAALGGMSLED